MEAIELARIRWLCRRGMGELDQLLRPFADDVLPTLPIAQQRAFAAALELSDPQLFALMSGRKEPEDPALAAVISAIHRHARD